MQKNNLKEKVLKDIRNVYKKGGIHYAIQHYVDPNYWVKPFKIFFPDMDINNHTNFDNSICFNMSVNISPMVGDDIKTIEEYVRKNGKADVLEVKISVVSIYAIVKFLRYQFNNIENKIEVLSSYIPFDKEYLKYREILETNLQNEYIRFLEDDILFEKIKDDISLQFKKGDITVYDCFFYDRWIMVKGK